MPTLQKRCKLLFSMGSVCGSVGGAVASDPRGSRFESSQLTKLLYRTLVYCQLYWKDENNDRTFKVLSILPITGFELQTSGVGSNHSTRRDTTTTHANFFVHPFLFSELKYFVPYFLNGPTTASIWFMSMKLNKFTKKLMWKMSLVMSS